MNLNLGDWNKPVPERHHDINEETGLPEGWTKSEQDIELTEDGFIQINSQHTALTISLGYVIDEDGDRAGIDMSQPALIIAAGNELMIEAVRQQIPRILRKIADQIAEGETRKMAEGTVRIERQDPGTNQQAEE
jgi:hypothetical protein